MEIDFWSSGLKASDPLILNIRTCCLMKEIAMFYVYFIINRYFFKNRFNIRNRLTFYLFGLKKGTILYGNKLGLYNHIQEEKQTILSKLRYTEMCNYSHLHFIHQKKVIKQGKYLLNSTHPFCLFWFLAIFLFNNKMY